MSFDKLARLIDKLRSKSRKRHDGYSEKENYNVRPKKCSAPSRKDINIGDRGQAWDGEDAEDIQHTISRHPDLTAVPLSPKRVDTGFAARRDKLKDEAQQQDLSSRPSFPHHRSTRSKTWESVKSVSVSSIRSVATVAQKALVCMPRLTRSESHIHPQFFYDPATTKAPESRPARIPEEANSQLSTEIPIDFFAKSRHHTFPLDKPTMPDSTELLTIQAKIQERQKTSDQFNQVWEDVALPRLRETMNENRITDYSISIQADYGESRFLRIVEVVTLRKLPETANQELSSEVFDIFGPKETPKNSLRVTISFAIGSIERSVGSERANFYVPPGNTLNHSPLMIGDSVGYENGDHAATIGPAIQWNDRIGCLVNFHLFDGATNISNPTQTTEYHLVHPAGIDCPAGVVSQKIAKLGAHSGFPMYYTQRESGSMQKFCTGIPENEARVETDWAFCDLSNCGLLLENRIRYAPEGREFQSHSGVIPGLYLKDPKLRLVRCSGRSSGLRYALVCETPVEKRQGTGKPTREWYLENVPSFMSEERWNAGGIGIPGDSGAAIVDDETRLLIGQVWGRNHYEDDGNVSGRRLAYFSHITDIFDDFKDRYPHMNRPVLMGEESHVSSMSPSNNVARDTSTRVTFDPNIEVNGDVPRRSKAQLPISVVKLLTRPVSQNSLSHSISGSSGTTFTEPGITLEIDASGKEIGDLQGMENSPRSISVRSSAEGLKA